MSPPKVNTASRSSARKAKSLASVSFKPAHPFVLEGIALDPARERIYVLAVALRSNAASIDPLERAAGILHAFKTKASGEKLESAVSGGTAEAKEGVLANPAALETESETQGHALSVSWNFGDGESETVNTDELQTAKVTHTFTQPGEHTITPTIHTDDLQTPETSHRETPGGRRRTQRSCEDPSRSGLQDVVAGLLAEGMWQPAAVDPGGGGLTLWVASRSARSARSGHGRSA